MQKRDWNKWSEEEDQVFKQALKEFGKDFQAISDQLKDRSYRQVRSHYYNYKKQKCQEQTRYRLICYDSM
ncbi:SANT/Myb_domain [Hexamita inflata]|uniref:SANT/Myb domain n=1 Tax=Hexamita inflata TaxID=28002 RepID=A0AA86NHH5_9EUKA|nr:SANT/Myb domain [Hexamita inflata]